jgi:glycosyltransferase involved in cell wall biosynthesis
VSRNDEPFVSVVTPFYDTADYLSECVESVLAQSHENFEYVLMDNQSKDGSTEIAREYARRDSRIKYFRTESFLTQIQNYNHTLGKVSPSSRYCKIVQADDWIFRDCLAQMVRAGEKHPTAGIVSSFLLAEQDVWGTGLPASPDGTTFMTGREAARLHLMRPIFLFGSPTTVMYRTDVVKRRNPFFEEGRFHPDTEANYEILKDHDFVFVHQILSFMRQQQGSITHNARHLNKAALDSMIVTKKYGPHFLSPEEYEARCKDIGNWFYDGLVREWLRSGFRFKNDEFWERQRRGLSGVGERIRVGPFANGLAQLVLKGLSYPVRTARKVLSRDG